MGLLWLLSRLPHRAGLATGRLMGKFAWWVFPFRKRVLETNLRICFPTWSGDDRRKVMKRHYEAMGMGIYEVGVGWYGSNRKILSLADFHGLDELQRLKQSGKAIILLGGHFTTIELVGRILLEQQLRFGILYRRPNNPVVDHFMTGLREARTNPVIHFNDIRSFIRHLRRGVHFWYSPDQARVFKQSILAQFFGEPAVTNAATGRIATMGNAAVLPFFGFRMPDGRYRIELGPEWPVDPDESPESEARRLNALYEEKIRVAPEQYLWLHKRFKKRGEKLPDVYA